MKKNPELTKMYKEYLSAKAEINKKADNVKQAGFNEKTTENTARKQQREEKNRILLQGNHVPAQSSREGYSNLAPGNKVSINRMLAKRNRMGRLINSKTGLPYPK